MWWVRIKHQWEFQRFSSLRFKGLFWVILFNFHKFQYLGIECPAVASCLYLDSYLQGYGFLQYCLLVICLSTINLGIFSSYEFEYFTVGVDTKFADRACLISERILIWNCGCYKPCTMGNPSCCEGLIAWQRAPS